MRTVVVHKNVTEIADDAFRDWANLEKIAFEPNSRLERIGDHTFANTALKEFTAPGSLKVIGSGAFMNCKSLKTVRLNEGLEEIWGWNSDDGAFQGSGLETIYLPSTLRRLRKETFRDCESLRKVCLADGCRADVRSYVQQSVSVEVTAPSSEVAEKPDNGPVQRNTSEAQQSAAVGMAIPSTPVAE